MLMAARIDHSIWGLSLDMVRGFAAPQPHHALGELTEAEVKALRPVCQELLFYRSQDRSGPSGAILVPDSVLFEFAHPQVKVAPGELTGIEMACGSLYFADICGELLAYRLLDEAGGAA